MKTKLNLAAIIMIMTIVACKKDKQLIAPVSIPVHHYYTSVNDFYNTNQSPKQIYSINSSIGGSFTTPQGTIVNIPANSFTWQSGSPVNGIVTIEFKDIYKKSDMLLSDMPTQTVVGPLKSAGEFFIKVLSDNMAVLLAKGKKITIEQPAFGQGVDTAMTPFVLVKDTIATPTWVSSPSNDLFYKTTSFVFSLYQFSYPAGSGTWGNSDNSSFFSMYTQTTLTSHCNNTDIIYKDVFLVFKDVNSMIHVYANSVSDNTYYYAPVGLKCTVVGIGVKDGKLYSSFTPITISTNQTVNFNLTETTDVAFKAALKALD